MNVLILSSCIQFTILSCLDYSKPAHSWYHFNIHISNSLYTYDLLKLQSKYNSLLSLINTYHTRPDSIYFSISSPVTLQVQCASSSSHPQPPTTHQIHKKWKMVGDCVTTFFSHQYSEMLAVFYSCNLTILPMHSAPGCFYRLLFNL